MNPKNCTTRITSRATLVGGFVILLFGFGLLVYETFFVKVDITYGESNMRDVTGNPRVVFKPNEPIFMGRIICKDKNVPGVVDREIRNLDTGAVYPLARVPSGAFVGCAERVIAITLPLNLPEGKYEFRSHAIYQVNSFRTYGIIAPPIPFEIKK